MFRILTGGLVAAALATSVWAQPSADEVIAAERAFAATALERGIADSFRAWAAPEAVIFRPDPVKAQAWYAGKPSHKGPPHLKWWPVWAGIAASGDMGFTTGPATFGEQPSGWYFTIWVRQPDGGWKWVLDHGAEAPSAPPAEGAAVARLGGAAARSASADAGLAEVQAAEARLNAGLTAAAFAPLLQDDSRVMGLGAPLTSGRAEVAALLAARPQDMTASPLGGGASKAGDLAYTYGEARWSEGGQPRRGQYVRLWQKRDGGWRLLFDEVTPRPA